MIVILAKVLVSKVAYIVHEFYESAKNIGFKSNVAKLMVFNRESQQNRRPTQSFHATI
jgi:hypothetical protein